MDEIIYARDLDDTGSMHICAKGDAGAVKFYAEEIAHPMIEALEMVSNFDWRNNRTHLLEIVNAAIVRARGEQS